MGRSGEDGDASVALVLLRSAGRPRLRPGPILVLIERGVVVVVVVAVRWGREVVSKDVCSDCEEEGRPED